MTLSTSEIILEYVCPSLGVISGLIMFFAPYRDVRIARDNDSLGDLNPTPWAFMLGNCIGWVAYSLLLEDQNLFVFLVNAPALIFSVWLNIQAVKLQYGMFRNEVVRHAIVDALVQESVKILPESSESHHLVPLENSVAMNQEMNLPITEEKPNKRRVTFQECSADLCLSSANADNDPHCVVSDQPLDSSVLDFAKVVWNVTAQNMAAPFRHENLVLFLVTLWVAVIAIVVFGASIMSQRTRELIVGLVVNLNLVFFYGAPLSTIFTVIQMRSSSTVHRPTMMTNTANGVFWFAYGLAILDAFIFVPNGLGALLGTMQIVLCVAFPQQNTGRGSTAVIAPVSASFNKGTEVSVTRPDIIVSDLETPDTLLDINKSS
jgi:solute carrier family 50 protein (sugar transporter)